MGNYNCNFRLSKPSPDFIWTLVRYDHPDKKKKKKHIHDLSSGKNYTISHFFRWKLETLTVRFSDMPNLMVRFLLRFFIFLGALIGAFVVFRGVYRPLSKVNKFSQTSMTCDGYMILDKYYISGAGVKSNSLDVPIVIKIPCFRVLVVIRPSCTLRTVCCNCEYAVCCEVHK